MKILFSFHFLRQRNAVLSVTSFVKNRNFSSKSDEFLSVTEDGKTGTAIIKLCRPPVNSLNLEMIQQITTAIQQLEKKTVKGFILTSELPNTFSAGLDINEMVDFDENRLRVFWKAFQKMWTVLYQTPLATVVAINGHAPAGGCMLALSCDYRIMLANKAKIGMTGTKLGIAVPEWFRALSIRNLGFRHTEKALSLGSLFSAQEALDLKMVDELASNPEDMWKKSHENLKLLVQIPDSARRMTKAGMHKEIVKDLNVYCEKELEEFVGFLKLATTQHMLKSHIENLKSKRVAT